MSTTIVTIRNVRIPARVTKDKRKNLVNGEDWVFSNSLSCIPGSVGWELNAICYQSNYASLKFEHAETGKTIIMPRDEVSYLEQD